MSRQKTANDFVTGTSRIPKSNPQVDHYGRKVALAILGPILVLLTLMLMSAFASPAAVVNSFLPGPDQAKQSQRIAFRDISGTMKSLTEDSEAVPNEFAKQAIDSGCFTSMENADNEKLQRCGRLVCMALSEVQRRQTESAFAAPTTLATYPDLIPNLQLAAIEACRVKWARGIDASLEGPACRVSELSLATRD